MIGKIPVHVHLFVHKLIQVQTWHMVKFRFYRMEFGIKGFTSGNLSLAVCFRITCLYSLTVMLIKYK